MHHEGSWIYVSNPVNLTGLLMGSLRVKQLFKNDTCFAQQAAQGKKVSNITDILGYTVCVQW